MISATVWAGHETFEGFRVVHVVLNGKPLASDVPGITFYGRTMLPVRSLTEALGASVDWLPDTNTAIVTTTKPIDFEAELIVAKHQLAEAKAEITRLQSELNPFNTTIPKQETLSFSSGDTYIGTMKNGLFNGIGTYRWSDGDTYSGEFKDDLRDGLGTYTWANGNVYTGRYKNGLMNGLGKYTFADGETHEGEFRGDVRHGLIKTTWPDGDTFVGEYSAQKRHGLGCLQVR